MLVHLLGRRAAMREKGARVACHHLVTSMTLSFTQIADLIPGVLAVWADEPVPAGPPLFLFERFPAVCTASFSAKKTLFERESFCLSHCCHLRMRWTLTFQYFENLLAGREIPGCRKAVWYGARQYSSRALRREGRWGIL